MPLKKVAALKIIQNLWENHSKSLNDYPHLSVKDELRCTCDISLQIGLVLRLYVVVASRSRVSNIRPNGRADGQKVHPYSNPALLEFLGIACGKMRTII